MSNLSRAKVVRGCWIVNAVDGLADCPHTYGTGRPAVRTEDAYPVCNAAGPAGAWCRRVTVTGTATSRKQTARLTAL